MILSVCTCEEVPRSMPGNTMSVCISLMFSQSALPNSFAAQGALCVSAVLTGSCIPRVMYIDVCLKLHHIPAMSEVAIVSRVGCMGTW